MPDLTADQIYATLDSFNPEGLSADDYEHRVLALLSPSFADAASVKQHFLDREPLCEPRDASTTPPAPLSAEMRLIADDCLVNRFSFKGDAHDMGEDIDWNHNPGFDHWVHDLNRFNFVPILQRTSHETGDDKYIRKAASLIVDWVDKNPVTDSWHWRDGKQAHHAPPGAWTSYLNIAIHLRLWAASFEALLPYWSPGELLRVLKSIHDQVAYLIDIVPTRENNWAIIGSNGLIQTCGRIPELKIAPQAIDFAGKTITAAADSQILPDGVQFELTQGYHRTVLNLFLTALECNGLPGVSLPDSIRKTCDRMLDYLMQMVLPSGDNVAFNDSDMGHGRPCRHMLEQQGRMRERDDWLYVGTEGSEGAPPVVTSQAFEHAGVYVMRTGWDHDDACLVFDGGPWGKSHQHNDRLSFVFAALGRTFIADPGRYLYDRNNPWSGPAYMTTTRAHSTITLDEKDQADWWFRDTWCPGPKLDHNTWTDEGGRQRIVGSHALGYGERDSIIRATHTRGLTFCHPDIVLIVDRVDPHGDAERVYDIASRLQFHPGDVVEADGVWHTCYDDANLAVIPWMSEPFDVTLEKGELDPPSGWYAPRVNEIEASPTMVVRSRTALPMRGGFLLVPYRGTTPPAMSLSVDGDTARAVVEGITVSAPWPDAASLAPQVAAPG